MSNDKVISIDGYDPRSDELKITLDKRELTLTFNFNTLAEFDKNSDVKLAEIFSSIKGQGIEDLSDVDGAAELFKLVSFYHARLLWWACLHEKQKELNVEAAGRLIHKGNIVGIFKNLMAMIQPFMPDSEESPPLPQGESDGTGQQS